MRPPAPVGWILALAERLVPAHGRRRWRLQWDAEVAHRMTSPDGGDRADVTRFALGSLAHALHLRWEGTSMRGMWQDVRQSAKGLTRRPGFSTLAALTLAVGIGAGTMVFSLAESVLLRTLDVPGGERLVAIQSTNVSRGFGSFNVSYPDFADFRGRTDLFESASFFTRTQRDLSGEGDPERLRVVAVHERFFETLGAGAVIGRLLAPDDHAVASESAIVLSEGLWVRRFGADSTVLGRTVRLDGVPHTVVGVLRSGHAWPMEADAWVSLQWGGAVPAYADARSNHSWDVVARLRPSVEVGEASAQLDAFARSIYSGPGIDERDAGTGAVVLPLRVSAAGDATGRIFLVLGAAVLLVVLIASVNASGLLLIRASGRARELSLRAALGAGRVRLGALLVGESLLLAIGGGALGVAVARWSLGRLVHVVPAELPTLADVRLNGTVLAGAFAISVASALLAALVPALRASRASVSEALKEGGHASSQGRAGARLRQGLVVVELALSLALLVAAGLTIRGFQRQLAADPGFEAEGLVTFNVRLPATRYTGPALVDAYLAGAVDRLERLPGVRAVTTTSRLPLGAGGANLTRSFVFDGATDDEERQNAAWIEVGPEYFETLGIRPHRGRAFTVEDAPEAPLVAILNDAMARRMAAGREMLGERIRSRYDENVPRTVVGIVRDIQLDGLAGRDEPVVFVPRAQAPRTSMAFVVRTADDPTDVLPAIRREMGALDPNVALVSLRTLAEAHRADLAGVRFLTVLFGVFGSLALILSVSGVYGLASYSVSQRTHEIGIRMAMGASAGAVRAAVVADGARLALVGVSVGLVVAYAFGRVVVATVLGAYALEPSSFAAVSGLLTLAVLAASWAPASRATRVDPVDALKSE